VVCEEWSAFSMAVTQVMGHHVINMLKSPMYP